MGLDLPLTFVWLQYHSKYRAKTIEHYFALVVIILCYSIINNIYGR